MAQIDRKNGLQAGAAIKIPVKAATTATTANITLSGEQTIDGVAVVSGDRVLVKDQDTASENGVYTVDTGTWNRAPDFDGNRDIVQGTLVSVVDGTTNTDTMWRVTTANPITIGSSSISFEQAVVSDAQSVTFTPSGAGASQRTVQSKLRDIISVKDFGAVGDGATDDTSAFEAARDAANAADGGYVWIPRGTYNISEFSFGSAKNVILKAEGTAYDYEGTDKPVVLNCTTGVFAIRIPPESKHCGIEGCRIQSNGVVNETPPHTNPTPAGVEYGVLIETFGTILRDFLIIGFQNGLVFANGANSNIVEAGAILWNTRTGLSIFRGSADTYAAYHPNLSTPSNFTSATVISLREVNIRSNGWGIVVRSGQPHFQDVVIESNFFGNIFYRGSLDNDPDPTFDNVYFENNWRKYDKDAAYDITEINFLKETASTWMTFTLNTNTALNDAGYQLNIASAATGTSAGGSFHGKFRKCTFHGGTQGATSSKLMYIKSAFVTHFESGRGGGGDGTNAFRFSDTANNYFATSTHFYDWNGPALPATIGNAGAKIDSGRVSGEEGGLVAKNGGFFQGLLGNLAFPGTQAPSSDANVLDDYEEGTWTPEITTASTAPAFTYNDRGGNYIKIGRLVTAWFYADVTVTSAGTGARAVTVASLPFTPRSDSLTGSLNSRGGFVTRNVGSLDETILFFNNIDPSAAGQIQFKDLAGAESTVGLATGLYAGYIIYEAD